MYLEFILNGNPIAVADVDEGTLLLDLLRERLGLTGTKRGCDTGVCGACAVLLGNKVIKACKTPVIKIAGKAVTTIEGLRAPEGGLSDLEVAFLECGAVQCGYCSPAMVIAGESLLRRTPQPTREQIRKAIRPNLCRCTGYQQIVDAVQLAGRWRQAERGQQHNDVNKNLASCLLYPASYQFIGKAATQNVDGPDKVTGRTKFVGDMALPGMLVAQVLRSSLPHARIVRLDVAPALAVPGVHAVLTHADFVNDGNFGFPISDNYMLAYRKVRYVGDPLAVVAAETLAAAQAGVAAIGLELDPLPVVVDMTQARAADAPLIPEKSTPMVDGEVAPRAEVKNLCANHIVRNGDPAPILAQSAHVLDETYTFPKHEHAYIETEGAFAIPEPDGGVTVYANNQSPFINRDNLAQVLGLPQRLARVIQPPVGGAFGGKDDNIYRTTAMAAGLALKTGRPVKLIYTRAESLVASYKRQASQIRLQIGADAEGNLQAAHAHVLMDSGAYSSMTPLAAWRATMHAAGAYRYQAVHVDTDVVYTNNGYAGAFRGFGNTQATAAVEMAIDELAQRLGRDPLAYRLQNCLKRDARTMTGDVLDHEVGLAACLEWVREKSGWVDKRAAFAEQSADGPQRRGVGVACYFHGSGLGAEGDDFAVSTIKIDSDNTITLTSGLTDYGQGSRTVFTMLAAEALGVSPERIRVLRPDTYTAKDSGPTVASRASIVGGNAVLVTARKLRNTLRLAAADLLNCTPEQLVREAELYIGPNEEPVGFEVVVAHAHALGLQLSSEGRWEIPHIHWDFATGTGKPYFCYVFGAQVVEVEVNMRTGKPQVVGIWAAHDAGTILYPQGALGQLYGGIAQGLGYGLMEAFRYENGIPQATTLAQYRIPRATDVPDIEATFIQTTLHEGPYGAKNMAEPVMMATAPAIVNAVFNATGVRWREIPVGGSKV